MAIMGKKSKNNNQNTLDNFEDINQKFMQLANEPEPSEPNESEQLPDGRLIGYCRCYFSRGFGFINTDKNSLKTTEKSKDDYFLLYREIDPDDIDNMLPGVKVSFIPGKNERGKIAKSIKLLPMTPDWESKQELEEKLREYL
jgi:cold shock CspA family protein